MAKKITKQSLPEDFESALCELEALVERMEQGETKLEDALQDFERGIALTRVCRQSLADAEQKVDILLKQTTTADTEPFDDQD